MSTRWMTLAVLATAWTLGPAEASAQEPGALVVDRAKVAFHHGNRDREFSEATVQVRARYNPLAGPSHFEIQEDAVEITIAGETYSVVATLDNMPIRGKGTILRYRRPRNADPVGLRSLTINTVKGRIVAKIDVADDDALRATGAWDVPIAVRVVDDCFERSIDMRATQRPRRIVWRHRVKDPSFRPIPLQRRAGSDFLEREARNVVIRDQDSWSTLWNEIGGNPEQLPEIDFDEHTIIGIFLGGRTGVGLRVDRVSSIADALVVSYTEEQPGANCVTIQALTYPYVLAKLPARTSSDQPILFKGRVRIHNCRR